VLEPLPTQIAIHIALICQPNIYFHTLPGIEAIDVILDSSDTRRLYQSDEKTSAAINLKPSELEPGSILMCCVVPSPLVNEESVAEVGALLYLCIVRTVCFFGLMHSYRSPNPSLPGAINSSAHHARHSTAPRLRVVSTTCLTA